MRLKVAAGAARQVDAGPLELARAEVAARSCRRRSWRRRTAMNPPSNVSETVALVTADGPLLVSVMV